MRYYNTRVTEQKVDFAEALRCGLGQQRGLFLPEHFPILPPQALTEPDLALLGQQVLAPFVGDSLEKKLASLTAAAFDFALPLVPLGNQRYLLELFHGPTLAFKDFGARFMARALAELNSAKITILTATSGDTGAAVAHAFHRLEGVEVVILYPKDKITPLQEKMFATLGDNITSLAVEGDFDCCQALVKDAFQDQDLQQQLTLTSANSINIARLLAQMVYYWHGYHLYRQHNADAAPWFVVPSGNFGNLTAGLMAHNCGLPAAGFVAATNSNDTVTRYLNSGKWQPRPTIKTLANAMDVSLPSNWERVEELFARRRQPFAPLLQAASCDDREIMATIEWLFNERGYIADPHTACAWWAADQLLPVGSPAIILATAHPSKFVETVEEVLASKLPLAPELAAAARLPLNSRPLAPKYAALRQLLTAVQAN